MKRVLVFSAVFFLSACVAYYTPTVDTTNLDNDKFETDLKECRAESEEYSGRDPASEGAVGAAIGAALGAAAGAIAAVAFDADVSEVAGYGAAVGAGTYGLQAASPGIGDRIRWYRRQFDLVDWCMAGRGYQLLED